jgi:predicted O-methyltransferase YrrM
MEHYWQNIQNWFTYPKLYKKMIEIFDNAHFVEVGNWKGGSVVYMGVEILNSKKNIKIDCVDNMSPIIFEELKKNIEPLNQIITTYNMSSIDGSYMYEDESLDFVFIDASHEYVDVKADLIHWYPKVKNGGVFAGHDYPAYTGVKTAVDEFFYNKKIYNQELCWIYYKYF